MIRRERGPLTTLLASVAVAALVALAATPFATAPAPLPGVAIPTEAPSPGGSESFGGGDPGVEDAPIRRAERLAAEDTLLRERLGGLASLVLPAGSAIEQCAVPTGVVPEPPPDAGVVDGLIAVTEELREHTLSEPIDVRVLDATAMADEVEERFAGRADPERIDLDTRVLTALGAIPAGADLADLRVVAFAEQVSGLHAGGDSLILLRAEDPGALSPLERTVLVHELEHAVTFQQLARPGEHRDNGEHSDQRRASVAVVEGSATLVMLQFARSVLDPAERVALREELLERAHEDALAGYTPYLLSELRFPYTEGLQFICERWLAGGWEAVDAVYTDPPDSSVEILFPDRYGEEPEQPRRLGTLAAPWERARTTVLGAAELLWLFEAPGGDATRALADPRELVSDWGGGRLVVWTDADRSAIAVALVDRGGALCDSVKDWYTAAHPDAQVEVGPDRTTYLGQDQNAVIFCDEDEVRLGMAPEVDDAHTLVD